MPEGLHDDQQFGEFGLSNDEGAARKRASLAADFAAQVEAKRAAKAAAEAATAKAAAEEAAFAETAPSDLAAQEDAVQAEEQSPDIADATNSGQPSAAVDERVFSERVAYGDVRHMSKNFYKGLIASIVVVVIVVVAIVILAQASL